MKSTKLRIYIILIVVCVFFVALAGLAYYMLVVINVTNKSNLNQKNNSQTSNSDSKQITEKYLGWNSHCFKDGGICLRYPKDWIMNETSDLTEITITNQSKTIQVVYNPSISGFGGYCNPNTCFFDTVSINKLNNIRAVNLEVIKGVYTHTAIPLVFAQYFVGSDDRMNKYNLKVGEKVDVGFFTAFFSSPIDHSVSEQLRVRPFPDTGFNSEQDAIKWLSEPGVITAGDIISSVYAN